MAGFHRAGHIYIYIYQTLYIAFLEAYLAITTFISGVAFKYGTCLLPLPKSSVTSLLASSIAEGASVLHGDLEEPLHPTFA